jgi:molecular chaperone DnaK (HSP70)
MTVDDLNDQRIKNALAQLAEHAKIELSARYEQELDESVSVLISLPTGDIKIDGKRLADKFGRLIGLSAPLTKSKFDELVGPHIESTIQATKALLDQSGTTSDVEAIVFVGDPSNLGLLKVRVSLGIGLPWVCNQPDPKTILAQGAALFAATCDWSKSED